MQGIERQSDYYGTGHEAEATERTASTDLPDPSEFNDLLGGPKITGGLLNSQE